MAGGNTSIEDQVDLGSKVELSFSCTDLLDMDVFSKSDPFIVLYMNTGYTSRSNSTAGWVKVGRTEVIYDNLNPKFAKTFILDYHFEEVQNLRVAVYDVDDKKHLDDLSRHDFIGEAKFTLGEVVAAGRVFTRRLTSATHRSCGFVHVTGEEVEDSKYDVTMKLYAKKLDKKDFFGKSDPFVEISKAQEGGTFTIAHRTQPIMKTLNPDWKEFTISMQKLCSGDWDRTLQFSVYDWNRSGSHELIGKASCSLREIARDSPGSGTKTQLELIHPGKKARKGHKYHNSGVLYFDNVRVTPTYSFVDYIRGGCEINLIVAIDFTGSNGKPQNPNSLHYNSPYKDNDYVSAIKSVATILADYDSDQQFPAFGFGARAQQFQGVSHCFPLNFNFNAPEVVGVQGILDAYHYTLSQVQLYGPTNFSSILDKTMEYARHATQTNQRYQILLIITPYYPPYGEDSGLQWQLTFFDLQLCPYSGEFDFYTDGIITDMEQTIDRIVKASTLPLSIVIVGVGSADFSAMEVLDADDTPLVNRSGVQMFRDIVQFVPLREFQRQGTNFSLARETLVEIPGQFLSYMKHQRIKPNPPVSRPPRNELPQPSSQQQVSATAPYPPQQQPPSYNAVTTAYSNQFTSYPAQPFPPVYPTGP